jgi:hypothetical protein
LARLQEIPVRLQLRSVDFGPRFDKPPLWDWKTSSKTLDRVYRKNGGVLLIVRVEVRPMVLASGFNEHANDDPEETGELRHVIVH